MSDGEEYVKQGQEQAVATWVNHLNQLRLDTLLGKLAQQTDNLRDALASVDRALRTVDLEVVATNRGGVKGMHGFIAEVAEVGVGNARSEVLGNGPVYEWVNDNGPVDMIREGIAIQQKFVAAGGRFGLGAIVDHLEKYPDFVKNGGKYQVPRDHFDTIRKLHAMPMQDAVMLSRSGDGPSFRDWQRVHSFFGGDIGIDSIEPSNLEYRDVQRGTYDTRLQTEKESLRSTDQDQRDHAYNQSRPTLNEGVKVTLIAAAAEAATDFVLAVIAKRRAGKQLRDFTTADWADLGAASGLGALKGGIRGITVYSLTNFTATSAAAASAVATSALSIAEQANKLRRGDITEAQFIENAEIISLNAAITALASLIGQAVIPVPVLGAIIGSTVGTIMNEAVSSALSQRETKLFQRYLNEQRDLDEHLAAEHAALMEELQETVTTYVDVLERAFSTDVAAALLGSVELARRLGVAGADILDTDEKIDAYFLD
ncbi:hypothetical protein [Curtobacterium sp. MCBD17_040]|uniref:hypothetical protein n=1 Tax=Curtobacterium sp. MCBD17_040 TaxID=2175674 RepID=UPI000DA904D4|nr:hypothetical protein [Curtobacterium sp. MCBD17_040]WIB65733.1 hypothetical protein DEI94_16575 [Curtobacterium sp. MCBD17_040]